MAAQDCLAADGASFRGDETSPAGGRGAGGRAGGPALGTAIKFALATAQIIKEEWDHGIKASFFFVPLRNLPY